MVFNSHFSLYPFVEYKNSKLSQNLITIYHNDAINLQHSLHRHIVIEYYFVKSFFSFLRNIRFLTSVQELSTLCLCIAEQYRFYKLMACYHNVICC